MSAHTKEPNVIQLQYKEILKHNSVISLLNRLIFLINQLNISLVFRRINYSSGSYTGSALGVNEEMELRKSASEFLGLVCFFETYNRKLLEPYRHKIDILQAKIAAISLNT